MIAPSALKTFTSAMNISFGDVVSIIGSGGKTSLLYQLALENRNAKVILSTTTKMYPPSKTMSVNEPNGVSDIKMGINIIYKEKKDGKLIGLSPQQLYKWSKSSDFLFLESDGSRGLPLKGWKSYEPVIPTYCNITVGICTIHPIGKVCSADLIHRHDIFCTLTGARVGETLELSHIVKMISNSNGLFSKSVGKRILLINQVETNRDIELSNKLFEQLKGVYNGDRLTVFYGSIHHNIIKKLGELANE